jgi:hypothetical protein
VDNNIRWFFICSTVAATTSLLCLVITAAVLAAIQEERSNEQLYKSIYYDQGFIHQPQTVGFNTTEELPSLSLQGSQKNDSHLQETPVHRAENTKLPHAFDNFAVFDQQHGQKLTNNPEEVTKASGHSPSENEKTRQHEMQTEIAPGNSIQKPNSSVDDVITNTSIDISADQYSEVWKQGGSALEMKAAEYTRNGDGLNSTAEQNNSKKNYESLQNTDIRNKTKSDSVHIMRISKIKTNYIVNETLNDHNQQLDPPTNTNSNDQFNRSKKSADDYQREHLVENNDQHQGMVITEDEHIYPKIFSNDETRDIMTMPSIKYESQDEENVMEIFHNFNGTNQTHSKFLSSKQSSEQEQPQYEKLPRSAREVRTVVAINILVASALELAWSLLSANIAWKGMRNCYPNENSSNSCKRTVEGLERLPPPPPPSDDAHISNKRNHKMDGMFRKPDIISNHRQCHLENSFHLTALQNKNGINRLHMINTVSERINTEPYLPMEESTMQYQERVHRFLASNNIANNASDNASNFDS